MSGDREQPGPHRLERSQRSSRTQRIAFGATAVALVMVGIGLFLGRAKPKVIPASYSQVALVVSGLH